MNCPRKDCGLPVWEYDEHTLTCKSGHHTRIGDTILEPADPSFRLPSWVLPASPGLIALALELFRLL